MILRPVSPLSPWGPPITKRPVGLMKYFVSSSTISAGMISSNTYFLISSWICSCVTSGSCCVEHTTASIRIGFPSSLYSTVTCVFPSGLKYGRVPSLRTFVSWRASLCAMLIGYGIYSSVSLEAYPNIIPWSPAPIASISSSPIFASRALSTPIAMSVDCSSIAVITAHVSASKPYFPRV